MKRVERAELLPLGAYEEVRLRFRERVIALKTRRRLELGKRMSIVFENHDTVLWQVQEMLRTERISDERAVAHELDTYNELVPPPGALSATLFVEYDDKDERARMLARLATLRAHVHLDFGGHRVTARFTVQFGEEMERLPAVNYLAFTVGVGAPATAAVAALRDPARACTVVIDHPGYPLTLPLPPAVREELARDLEA